MANTKIGFFERVSKSVTDINFYKNIFKEPLGNAFKYLFLLALLLASVVMIDPILEINNGFSEFKNYLETDIPDFVFKDGELNMSGKMPVILDKSDTAIYIIDTSGRTKKNILNSYEEGVLITKYKIISKEDSIKTEEYDLTKLDFVEFTKKDLLRWLNKPIIIIVIDLFIFIFAVLFMVLGKFANVFFLSLCGLIIKWIKKSKITYGDYYKLVIYAVTLPILIATFLDFFSITIPLFGIFYFGIFSYYLWKAFDILPKK